MKTDTFIETLMSGDNETINNFILKNGKKQKPICPIYFFEDQLKEEEENERGEFTFIEK